MLLLASLETTLSRIVASLMLRKQDIIFVYPHVALFEGNARSLRFRCVAMLLANDGGSLTAVAQVFRVLLSGAFGGHLLDDVRAALGMALLRKDC